jgi:anti-sigma B factor antagonist
MKIRCCGETLSVSEIEELGLANSDCFGREVRAALADGVKHVVIDLSSTGFMDCTGLGALAALSKTARATNGGISVHLLNPTPHVQRIALLTRSDGLFQIAQQVA